MKPVSNAVSSNAPQVTIPWLFLLRVVLATDAIVLCALGLAFVLAPGAVLQAFHFGDLPAGARYLIGTWGCVFTTLGLGYAVAATQPLRHLVWVQIGILRGFLEAAVGLYYLTTGVVSWKQAGLGIVVGALLAIAYLVLYPRRRRDIRLASAAE